VRTQNRRPKRTIRPKVGLDTPCKQCGDPVYYNYHGPIEGLCGRCADLAMAHQPTRDQVRTLGRGDRKSRIWVWLTVALAFAAGGIAGYLAHGHLPF